MFAKMKFQLIFAITVFLIQQIEPKTLIATRLQKSCGTPTIINGNFRAKQRGRSAIITCSDGFLMHGQRYAICNNGKWDIEIPLCIKGVCTIQPDIPNGQIAVTLNSAKSEIFCNSGYEINGNQLAFCNGEKWDRKIGSCKPSNNTMMTSCDFESISMCGWTHDTTSDYTWMRKNGDNGALRTGPKHDHTTGVPLEGHYMLLESSVDRYNESARLISPIYPGERSQNTCLKFFYHMYGQSVGSLMVFVKPESVDIEIILKDDKFRLWKETGTQKNIWRESIVNMVEVKERFQIVFEGTSIGSHLGDIAIDDISLIGNEECWNEIPETTTEETGEVFTTETCLNRCDEPFTMVTYPDKRIISGPGAGGFIKSCFCFEGCERVELCCPDYPMTCLFNDSSIRISATKSSDLGNFGSVQLYKEDAGSSTTESSTLGNFGSVHLYQEEAVTVIKEEITTTTKSYGKMVNETGMNMEKIKDDEEKSSSGWMTAFWIIFSLLICGVAFYGIYYKLYRKSNGTFMQVRYSRGEQLLEMSENENHL